MGYKLSSKTSDLETRINSAITALNKKDFPLILAAATYFNVSNDTLCCRMARGKSHT